MISNDPKTFADTSPSQVAPGPSRAEPGFSRGKTGGSQEFALVKTRDGTSTLTLAQVKAFESDFFDGWLECARPNQDGHLELLLPVNTKVWKRAVTCMEAKAYSAPPSWSGDEVLPRLLEEQLSFYAPRPLTAAISRAEAAKVAAAEAAKRIPAGFVRIEAGEFRMGSSENEAGRFNNESPRRVELTRAFWYQSTPVTQGQWQSLMGSNPSRFHADGPGGELASERPVEMVNWYEAAAYCNALSVKEGLSPYYELTGSAGVPGTATWVNPSRVSTLDSGVDSYRLPSEAEQQRARRGSDALTATNATYAPAGTLLGGIAWYGENSGERTHPVGRLLPTNEGVHDALGNVWEWGNDWYAEHLAAVGANGKLTDPVGPDIGTLRVCGGGGWVSPVRYVRAAFRNVDVPTARYGGLGFRPARFVPLASGPLDP